MGDVSITWTTADALVLKNLEHDPKFLAAVLGISLADLKECAVTMGLYFDWMDEVKCGR